MNAESVKMKYCDFYHTNSLFRKDKHDMKLSKKNCNCDCSHAIGLFLKTFYQRDYNHTNSLIFQDTHEMKLSNKN